MTMTTNDKKMLEREALRSVIQQWNANRLDLFELSEPDENLQFHGVMRFYFQDAGQKVATKCIRVASDATVADVIETLVEKFRPDMRMLTLPNYALYEVHSNHEERKLNPDEKPLLVQLNWHIDDREGRFLLKNIDQKTNTLDSNDTIFKRKLSKREKKEQKKKDKLAKLNSNSNDSENHVAERLYTELPETSFTRSISNPEAVMRRRRQQKLEKKLQQFRSRDGGPDTDGYVSGGTLKIYGESLCRDVPYKTLLLSIRDCAQAVVREMLSKYGMEKADPLHYCLVQVNADATEYILDDDECPLSILMNHPTSRGSIMFHVRRRPADSQPRRRKKKPLGVSNGSTNVTNDREGPTLVEITHSGDGGRRVKLGSEPIEVGSANTNTLQLFGPSIQPRHCLISLLEGVCTVTPLHTDALTFVNGHHIQQPTILHNGSVVMFGRVASYRFIDSPSDGRYNLALSQSQLDSACLYESRSPISSTWPEDERPLSPVHSVAQAQTQNIKQKYVDLNEISSSNSRNLDAMSKQSFNIHINSSSIHNNSHQHHLNAAGIQQDIDQSSQHNEDGKSVQGHDDKRRPPPDNNHLDVPYDIDGNTENETKSISSIKSTGSNQDIRSNKMQQSSEQGQEPILPAVLEFPETHQDTFLRNIISELDVNTPNFKLAPVYTLYLCARYRASTHYRPDLQPTERAHKLTVFLHHVANLIHNVVQDQYTDPKVLSFWMANSSEFLYFLKSDRHISAFSVQAQEVLAESVQTAFRNLVTCFHAELSQTLSQFMSENIEHEAAAGLVLQVLGSAMALFRRCRVNAALTIQLFSQLFHYINVLCFNKIVTTTYMCTAEWGKVLSERLQLLELWAERQGLELAADCHLAKINQCSQFLQAPKATVADVQQLACSCFKLNSLQMAALLSQETIPRNLVDTAVRMAESVADELARADGREIRLEESPELPLALILPDDGFSCDVVRGIPAGLVDFLTPLQGSGMCRLAAQPTSIGLWTVYMHHYNGRSPSAMSAKTAQPEVQVIKLHKHSNGMGLSIVAAKGAGQERLGIYIKSVVPGGAADLDGRLQAGDQLLRVDGQSLIGITQERAADYLVRTGPVVTLEVAKQGAIYHGLATLLQQPSPVIQRGIRDDIKARYKCRSDESLTRSGLFRNDYLSNSSNYLNRFNEPLIGAYSSVPERRNSTEIMFGRKNSLSHESILNTQYPKIPVIDPRYRDSRPIVHTSSSSFEINWDMNPTILVEEYKDNPEPERIATSIQQENPNEDDEEDEEEEEKSEEDDENVGYCGDDSDDIPFIDDENSSQPQCEIYIPPKMKEITRCGIMTDKNKKNNLGYRKTVSFDTSKDFQEKCPAASISTMIPKSKTYEYVIDLEFNKPDSSANIQDKLSNNPDRISVYFNNNDDIDYRNSNNSHNNQNTSNKIDINDITLDLTGLSSDSTTCSSSFGEKFYSNNSISVNVSNNNQNINHSNNNNNDNDFPDMKTTKDQFNNSNSKISNNNNSSSSNTKGDYIKHNETPYKIIYAKQKSYDDLLAESSARNFNSGTRRMSERDLSRQSNADSIKPPIPTPSQNLLNAKSTPALHHVGNIAMSGNKSRSIHNLVGNNTMTSNTNSIDQGFYQNLSIYRAQNQSQPNLGDRTQMSMQSNMNINAASTSNANLMQTSNRPASAYFNNTNSNTLPSQSTMSYMMQPNNNANSSQNPIMAQSSGGNPVPGNPMLARQKNNNFSGSQNMRMNQMMAPSMPNIAHSSGYAANISASQSMQNVNMISNYHPGPSNQHMYTTTPNELQQQQQQHQQQQQQQRLLRGQAKLAEMGEELKRRHQRQPADMLSNDISQIIVPSGSGMSPQLLSPTGNQPNQSKQQIMLPGQQNYPNQQNSNGPMSPIKQLPPTAPKPNRLMQDNGETHQQMPLQQQQHQPPLPPTQTHPLFKNTNQQQQNNVNLNYIASVADPPKVAYYPISSSTIASSKNFVGSTNPWEREEREKEQEMRREHIRQWRDQQIFELSSLQHRTPQQDEQLRTLVLERDFERRAQETEEQEEDIDMSYSKDSVQELIRLQPASQLPTPMTSMKQVDIKDGPSENYIPPQQSSTLPTIQPKSILKHNNNRMDNPASSNPQASPSKQAKSATFADDKHLPDLPPPSTSIMNQMMKDIYNMNLNNSNNVNNSNISKELELANMPPAMQSLDENFPNLRANMMYDTQNNNSVPPPPPERNSSYVIMSQQQQKNRTSTLPNMTNKHTAINPPAQSTDSQNNNYQMNNTKKIPTISNNLNNNHSNNNSSLINNNVGGSQALPPQIQIPPSQIQYNMQQPLTPPSQFNRDNKRVSFHDEENNLLMSSMQQMAMSGMTDQQQLEIIREDPNRFINETQELLDSPMTPDSESWNSPIQMTPGVIGAQEVYRDPRTRRLAEKQQAQQQKTDGQVPEKLSFKEKMKMFALESGEDQTPKDKVKISRAQRDIDAVH